jgi:hypothetical protein
VSKRTPALALCCLAGLLLGACASKPSERALQDADYGPAPNGSMQGRIRAAFTSLLIEPDSAEFRYGEPEQGWGRDGSGFVFGWVVWTEVNSKNRFGAFTGWQGYKVLMQGGDVHSIYQPNGKLLFGNPKFRRAR